MNETINPNQEGIQQSSIGEISIEDVKPYKRNAKEHNDKQIKLIAESIKRFGFNQSLVIDKNNEIVVGHGRYEAAKLLGLKKVPFIRKENLTDEEIKSYRLADNQINALTGFKMDLVIEELKGLDDDLVDLTGFDADLLIEADEADDVIPENVPAVSKLGDLYELGSHRVLCGDSTKAEDVERLMNGKKADMVFTDPPYSMDLMGAGCFKKSTENVKRRIDNLIDFDPDTIAYITKLNIPSFYICTSKELIKKYLDIFQGYNFNILIWCKTNPTPWTNGTFMPDVEYIMFFGEKGKYIWNNNLKPTEIYKKYYLSNKLEGRKDCGDLHPTMKPVELIKNRILISSNKEGIVLDLFLGSGSTLIASDKTGRICYGCELSEAYTDVIVQRYVDFTGNENIIKNGIKTIWKQTKKMK